MRTAIVIVIVAVVCISALSAGFLLGNSSEQKSNGITPTDSVSASPSSSVSMLPSSSPSMPSPTSSSSFPEHLAITNVEYGGAPIMDSTLQVWIAVTVNNTGLSTVTIAKLLVDNVKLSPSSEMPIVLNPDQGAVINATFEPASVKPQIDVLTSNGKMFSKTDDGSFAGITIGFMGTSSVTVTGVTFDSNGGADDQIVLDLKNTGTKTATVAAVKVNNVLVDVAASGSNSTATAVTLGAGDVFEITLSQSWVDGNTYKMDLYDGSNQVVGSVQQNAPGA